jgi:hypothetical protein
MLGCQLRILPSSILGEAQSVVEQAQARLDPARLVPEIHRSPKRSSGAAPDDPVSHGTDRTIDMRLISGTTRGRADEPAWPVLWRMGRAAP